MIADGFDDILPAIYELKHAFWQSGFAQQLGNATTAQRNELGRLENHAVAERDRVGDRPVRHHVRKIERRDRGHDAEREALEAAEELEINQLALVYLNRLSDLLFILARAANTGREEILWKPGASR